MFTEKDIETRTIFIINCIEKERKLRVKTGELLLEESSDERTQTLTKFPFQKILALFVIGHITITTPLIEKCHKFNVALIVVKPNLRPVFYWANTAEGNFLLRKQQYGFPEQDLTIAKTLVENKITNQQRCLEKTRKRDKITQTAIDQCKQALDHINHINEYNSLMGLEGAVSRDFFAAYFQDLAWNGRKPRTKCDCINVTLDIGYTILFNFLECVIRMFGFDLYVGVYHKLWFKRKSLVCDLIEPFRCIIDHTLLLGYHRNQFSEKDFRKIKDEYILKTERSQEYYKIFSNAIIDRKTEIFRYIRDYYRAFMGNKPSKNYPKFNI